MDVFRKELEQYDASKLEVAMQALMKQLAATLSRQHGIQYEFGPEFKEHSERKAAGTLSDSHLKPLSEVFTEEQLQSIPMDNKAGEYNFVSTAKKQRRFYNLHSMPSVTDLCLNQVLILHLEKMLLTC